MTYSIEDMYSINFTELLSKSSPNYEGTYDTINSYYYREDDSDGEILSLVEGLEKSDYAENLATTYIVEWKGDARYMPDAPYLISQDIDLAKALLIFDDDGTLLFGEIYDISDELHQYAVLTMTNF